MGNFLSIDGEFFVPKVGEIIGKFIFGQKKSENLAKTRGILFLLKNFAWETVTIKTQYNSKICEEGLPQEFSFGQGEV